MAKATTANTHGDCLPCNVKTHILSSSMRSHVHHMAEVKGNIANSSSIIRHSMARQFDEPSPQQARAIDKILRLPTEPTP